MVDEILIVVCLGLNHRKKIPILRQKKKIRVLLSFMIFFLEAIEDTKLF